VQSRTKLDKAILDRPAERPVPKRLIWTNSTDQKVYDVLVEQGPLTRDELVARTKVARTTIYDALTRLSIRGLVTRFTEPRQSRGRRRVFYNVLS
jgi:predicted transcriptional regulator